MSLLLTLVMDCRIFDDNRHLPLQPYIGPYSHICLFRFDKVPLFCLLVYMSLCLFTSVGPCLNRPLPMNIFNYPTDDINSLDIIHGSDLLSSLKFNSVKHSPSFCRTRTLTHAAAPLHSRQLLGNDLQLHRTTIPLCNTPPSYIPIL